MKIIEDFIDIFWSLDTNFNFAYASPAVEKLLGSSQDEILGVSFQEFATAASYDLVKKSFTDAPILDSPGVHEVPIPLELELIHRNGTSVWFEILQVVLRDDNQAPIGLVVAAKDISNQVRALRALKESEEKYRALVEQSVLGITIAKGNPVKLVYVNDTIEEMLGYSKAEMLNWKPDEIAKLIHPEDRTAFFGRFQDRLHGKQVPESYEFRAIRKTGESVWFDVHGARIEYESEPAVIALFIEITKRRLAQREADESRKFTEFLIDLMSHDLNNIHQGMMTGLELVIMRGEAKPETLELLESIISQLQRADDLISRVRTLSDVRSERFLQTSIDIHGPISKAIQSIKNTFPKKEIVVNLNINPGEYFVEAGLAGEFLMDVFYNLFHNSVKFDVNSPITIDINTKLLENRAMLQIVVEDRACGISDAKKRSILRRLDDGQKTHSGIGLTLAKEILDRYGGKIRIENRIDGDYSKGSRFVISLQLHQGS
ncbi:MAG: PAS domain S-box protein [Candidatus Thorarchaeota archaeon]